ncbi:MAG: DUF4249 domain-containing protein [Spirosomataceae bacterium]
MKSWHILWVILACTSCIEVYKGAYNFDQRIVTVEGNLTTLPEAQKITLKNSVSLHEFTYDEPITKAQVELLVNGTQKVTLAEQEKGVYYVPSTLKIEPGNTYQLRFTTPEGKHYESNSEPLMAVPSIKVAYNTFGSEVVEIRNAAGLYVKFAGNQVYVDYDDPANVSNYYLWNWTLWENQPICATCMQGYYQPTLNGCVKSLALPSNNLYDYYCGSRCWEILNNSEIIVSSDALSNGKTVKGALVAQIPYYYQEGCLVEIRQSSVSKTAYQYFKLLQTQSQTTGTLADTPPASIAGNVHNVSDSQEPVVGYFYASDVTKVRHWVDRKNAAGTPIIGGLLGRQINLEPSEPMRPPLATCVPSKTRTPIKPEGWPN